MEENQNKKGVNLYKYALVVLFISFFWAFIGGSIIALNHHNFIKIGALIAFFGMIFTFFVFDFAVKKGRWKWILK